MVLDSENLHMGHLKDTEFATENRRRKRINGARCQSSVGCSSERQGCLESEGMCSRGMRPNGNTMTSLNERIRRDNRSESKSSTNSVVVNDGHADCDGEQHPFHESSSQRCMRQQNAQTLQDLYNQQEYIDDDDEDDDSDWEPLQKHADRKKWFCTNCTMANYDDVVHCNVWPCICSFRILLFEN